ncbi:ABC transporter substrate-binding protein [Acidisphaera sp. L21]|jgi:sn-glycerol 3-phosphate transport system substrate-binding protein|uniref:ABC transporter substrate-binding protein n=1 Tax=Acidisphaera sp. L21 TaxID=1641851 RepID=UPI00131E3914|nr:ABC transporter substrate-binding protein [Acidisphaera sp. L21]
MLGRRALLGALPVLAAPAIVRAQTAQSLTFYYPIAVGGPLQAVMDGYCADYKKETGVTVNPVYAGNYGDALTKAQTAIKAGQGPHFAVLLAAEMHSLQDADILVSLDEIGLDADGKKWVDSFYPAFMANSHVGGKTWSVPFQRSTLIAYYNKQAFSEAGLDPEAFPKDWAGMSKAAQTLTKQDGSGRVTRWGIKIAGDLGNAQWTFGALANQVGQKLMNEAGTETYFDAPKTVEALTYWRDLAPRGTPPGISAWPVLSPDFLEGNTAIIWHTTGNLTNLRGKAKFPFGVAGVPGKDSPHTVVGGGNLYFFKHASAAERTASLRFAQWISAPERAADWSIKTGYIASSPAAYDTPALKQYVAGFPAAAVARDFLPVATGELSTFENQRIQKVLTDQIQAVLNGQKEPGPALADAQRESTRVLRQFL